MNSSSPTRAIRLWLVFPILFLARLGSLGRVITPDEYFWVHTSIQFRKALFAGAWGQTIQAPHPGVVTTWLTTIGIQLTLFFNPDTSINLQSAEKLAWAHGQTGEVYANLQPFLTLSRISVISIFAIGLTVIYFLLEKRFGTITAIITTVLIGLDPWIVGLSSILHVDALMGLFCCISILLVLTADQLSNQRLILIGISTSLAILCKLPGIVLLGTIPLMIIAKDMTQSRFTLRSIVTQITVWGAAAILTSIILLPALIFNPLGVWQSVIANSSHEINIQFPIFFMGEAQTDVVAFFYPQALFIRQSPLISKLLRRVNLQLQSLRGVRHTNKIIRKQHS